MIGLDIRTERVERALAEARERLGRTRPLMGRLGKTLEGDLRGHFLARDREGNRRGWPTKHFWNREVRANTTLASFSDERATVAIASPAFRQKLYGGRIKAKRARFLAIPARAEAYAAGSPREGGMELFRPKGRFFLIDREGLVQYWLVREVVQAADPRALPDMDQVGKHIGDEAERWVRARTESRGVQS